jgi:phosphohistidine phosphatase SixA
MLHLLASLVFASGVVSHSVSPAELRRQDLMSALQSGGYTVLLRHARTDRTFQEDRTTVPKERSAQRNLSDDGIRDAALMGVVFRKYGITFSEIISSPMFRTVETAEMAAGKPTMLTMALRVFPTSPEQTALIMKAPKRGTNRLLVTHHFVIEANVPGIKPGDVDESEAAVVRHLPDGKIELVGRISLDDWRILANPSPVASSPPASSASVGHNGYAAPATPSSGYSAAGNGTPSAAVIKLPDTHAGHLASEYIAAFNSGSPDKMRGFIESAMLADPARPMDKRLETYAKLFEDFGPLSVARVDSSEATYIALSATSKKGDLRLMVKSSDAEPMRIQSITFATGGGGEHR